MEGPFTLLILRNRRTKATAGVARLTGQYVGSHTDQPINELSLFSGAGGGLLGSLLLGWRTCCCVEIDEYCQRVLRQRMQDGWLDPAPIWDDVLTFDGRPWRGRIDIVTAGFPCQPFSVAGKRLAARDERDMWPDTARLIREVRPPVALLENVPGLTSGSHGYFGRILGELAESGFNAEWEVIPAAAADAPHLRERLWVLAWDTDANRDRLEGIASSDCTRGTLDLEERHDADRLRHHVGHADRSGREEQHASHLAKNARFNPGRAASEGRTRWRAESEMGRLVDGVADRVDRLRALGNGQVAPQMALAWTILSRRLRNTLDAI